MNLSIAGPGEPSTDERDAINGLIARGTTIVAAMGNERAFGSPTSYPAAIPGVIAVGATNLNDKIASFSSRGNHICLCAPGQAIWSTLPTYEGQVGFLSKLPLNKTNAKAKQKREADLSKRIPRDIDYGAWNGTSMAAPHVTGAVALLLANQGRETPSRVREKLENSADRTGGAPNPDFGAGRLNLLKLLQ